MTSFPRLLSRAVVAGLGFSAAVFVAVVVATAAMGTVAAGRQIAAGDEAGVAAFFVAAARGEVVLPLFPTIVWPAWLVAVVLGEVTATRSLLAHLVVATGIAVVGVMGGAPAVGPTELAATVATGLSAGFVHWLVAGRGAGLSLPRRLEGAPRGPHDGRRETGVSEDDPRP